MKQIAEIDLVQAQLKDAERRAAKAEVLGQIDTKLAALRCRQLVGRYRTELAEQRVEERRAREAGYPSKVDRVDAQYEIVCRIADDLGKLSADGTLFRDDP